jgi:hypothetical protein
MRKLSTVFLALLACGCVGTPIPTTRAMVAIHDVVAPRYRVYVETDTGIDEMTRENLLATIEEWDRLCDSVRADIGPMVELPK